MNKNCKKHPDEKLTLFCDHCECLACRDCAIATHRGHSCNFITDVEAEFREEFADKIDRSEEKLMNLTGKNLFRNILDGAMILTTSYRKDLARVIAPSRML